jgi:DNA primase
MTIPTRFLDDLRARLTLSDVVGKRVRLTRAGREFKGCCPFHNEKTPSFYVNDDKQFFHCFGCGAHGSVIDFAMRHENLSFPEAVEALAQQVGMQVPKSSPEEVEKAKREKTLYTMLDEAAKWMEGQLRGAAGRAALKYMLDRGVPEDVMASFRIGYAPDDMQALRKYLSLQGYTDAQMIEGGLIKTSEKAKEPYAFFRERVMFPVPDRRGRIVAFGGRVLPEHLRGPSRGDFTPPKYINSSDTPLFHKGRMLYGEPHARMAAAEGQTILVVEGYLDVIAAFRAGFKGAVAPLGTALTEDQIAVLWKMIPEDSKIPILCFDGDNAGRRAAARACERILPMLKPDHSAKIAFLPEGEDPDSIIQKQGPGAFQAVLQSSIHLVDFLWADLTAGKPFETPESRAGLSRAVDALCTRITDRSVQHYYKEAFREKIRKAFASPPPANSQPRKPWQNFKNGRQDIVIQPISPLKRPSFSKAGLGRAALLAALINNPASFGEVEEEAGQLYFPDNKLDQLRQHVLSVLAQKPELDGSTLKTHLIQRGMGAELSAICAETVYNHAGFARPSEDIAGVATVWKQAFDRLQNQSAREDLEAAKAALRDNPCEENENRVRALREIHGVSDG